MQVKRVRCRVSGQLGDQSQSSRVKRTPTLVVAILVELDSTLYFFGWLELAW